MPQDFPRESFEGARRAAARAAMLLLLPLLIAGTAACESNAPAPRAPGKATAEEVFEAFEGDAVIEEETIAPPPRPAYLPPEAVSADPAAPPAEPDREQRRRPLSSPGAAPSGTAPSQPITAE